MVESKMATFTELNEILSLDDVFKLLDYMDMINAMREVDMPKVGK